MRKRNFKPLRFFLFLILITGEGMVYAQQPEFTVTTSATRVAQNTVFDVQFELRNANGSDFAAPFFEGFKVVGGPSVGSSAMNINGVVSRSQSWSYSLLAFKQGKFTIGPAAVIAGRKKLTSGSVIIDVVAPKNLSGKGTTPSSREPVILKAELNAENYYPGQQIILTYRLLFRENVQTVSTLTEDDYADFFIQTFSGFSREATYETINGLQFTSRIVKSMALFAHQSGIYTIEPMIMSVGINAPFPGNQGFFTMRRIEDIQVASDPITLTILPIPSEAPASFSGAVGQYQMNTVPGNTRISTDDAFTLKVAISGNGDSRRWDPPVPVTTGDFEIYDPKILEDRLMDAGNQVSHVRSVEYQMIPTQPGEWKVYVPLTFFDPEIKQYVTISSDTISLQVSRGTNTRSPITANDHNASAPPALMKISRPFLKDQFWTSIPHLFVFTLILSGVCLGLVVALRRRKEDQIPQADKIRSFAGRQARMQLDVLYASGEDVSVKDFFENAVAIYYKFLEDRFNIMPSELDASIISTRMASAGITESIAERAMKFYNQCLVARYGGTPGGFTKSEMISECNEIISLLEG